MSSAQLLRTVKNNRLGSGLPGDVHREAAAWRLEAIGDRLEANTVKSIVRSHRSPDGGD